MRRRASMFHDIPLRRKCQTLLGYGGGESPISPEMRGTGDSYFVTIYTCLTITRIPASNGANVLDERARSAVPRTCAPSLVGRLLFILVDRKLPVLHLQVSLGD